MAKSNRPSVQKREREQLKRQRERIKAEKAAEKRERRFNQSQLGQPTSPPPGPLDDASKLDKKSGGQP